jgi:hypothetical protein
VSKEVILPFGKKITATVVINSANLQRVTVTAPDGFHRSAEGRGSDFRPTPIIFSPGVDFPSVRAWVSLEHSKDGGATWEPNAMSAPYYSTPGPGVPPTAIQIAGEDRDDDTAKYPPAFPGDYSDCLVVLSWK